MKAIDMTLNFKMLTCLLLLLVSDLDCMAQYDTVHYIPPFYSRSDEANELGRSYLHLSTNSTAPFYVTVKEADGSTIMVVPVSRSVPKKIWLGYQYNCIGIVDSSALNTPLNTEGIICTASQPFFANIRHSSGNQGMSLTAKGTAAKGTRFRSGHLYTALSAGVDGPYKSHMISVMATEDNTTVTFSDFKQGVIFYNTPTTNNTTDDITVTLNKHESYIIAAHLDEANNSGNGVRVNGVLIESDRPIVVNTGSWCGGADLSNQLASRDIGMDQIVPTALLGTEHIVVKRHSFLEEECERVIIISDKDNTAIFINGGTQPVSTLDAGDFFITPAALYDNNDVMYITSSEPVYVYQSTNGSDSVSYAQGMSFIPPLICSGLQEVTIPEIDSFDGAPAGIDIIAKTGSTVLVDGLAPTVAPVPVTGNPNWEVYKLSDMTGTVHFWSNDNINISMIANVGARGAASYFSGFSGRVSDPTITAYSLSGGNLIAEDCVEGRFVITKPVELLNQDVTYPLQISGQAVNGVDYTAIADSILIPAGSSQGIITILALEDGLTEQQEEITVSLASPDACSNYAEIAASLIIDREPEINFTLESGLQCLPFDAQFIDLSTVGSGATYKWDFGDGSVSYEQNPVHSYTEDGFYTVTLTVVSPEGCIDTLVLAKSDLVNVHPTPLADFKPDTELTDICNSLVNFADMSTGGDQYYYSFDDGEAFSTEQNPSHLYLSDGTHRVMQVTTTNYGCSDTAYRELFIEPFNIYAPNTFTPDGNELNNTFYPVIDLEVYEWNLTIYNRWGEPVFETNDVKYGWDGTTQTGDQAPDGTYQWVLKYVSCEPVNPTKMIKGHVNLIR